jgi:Transposase DDE domain group 1
MGESKRKREISKRQESESMAVDTLGGRIHVQWDQTAQATPHGQLVFFAEFLACAGVFDEWVNNAPLEYKSGNAPDKRDVLGTLVLAVLAGHRRYAHITALRGDTLAAKALGMNKTVSEDAVRRALERIDETSSAAWLRPALMRSIVGALDRPWILDIDTSIKPLYGKQQGAEIGYNPHKPGRPSHALHTYWVGNLRLVLDVQVSPGKQSASLYGKAGLGQLLDELKERRPELVRGDCGYGNEGILVELEQRQQPYLLRLRQTKNIKRLIERQFARQDWTQPDAQGWQAVESKLKLAGWTQERRVVILRRRIRDGVALQHSAANKERQLRLALPDDAVLDAASLWEYSVLVTDVKFDLGCIAQLYRDRCDCENGFDELKNQWGLSGFTTKDLTRCQTTARIVALVYNWWSWYCRAAHPDSRLEAITSRPLLLAAVGKASNHAGQTQLYLTALHAKFETIKSLIANIRQALQHVTHIAEQFPKADRWNALLTYISDRIVRALPNPMRLLHHHNTG